MLQFRKFVYDWMGNDAGDFCEKETPAVFAIPPSGMDLDTGNVKKRLLSHSLNGSYTVEASLVMSIALFFIASLLIGIFQIHSRVVGNFVLQEALERYVFLAEGNTEEQLEGEALNRLRGFFYCGNAKLQVEETETRKNGQVETAVQTEISVKEYQPENTLRLWTVLTAGSGEEENGSSLQKRNEP